MHSISTRQLARNGWLSVELAVAAALVIILTTAFSRMVFYIHDARVSQYQRHVAMECLENVTQQLFMADSSELENDTLAAMRLPAWAAKKLPGGTLTVERLHEVASTEGEFVLQVTITWHNATQHRVGTTMYRYASPGEQGFTQARPDGGVTP